MGESDRLVSPSLLFWNGVELQVFTYDAMSRITMYVQRIKIFGKRYLNILQQNVLVILQYNKKKSDTTNFRVCATWPKSNLLRCPERG